MWCSWHDLWAFRLKVRPPSHSPCPRRAHTCTWAHAMSTRTCIQCDCSYVVKRWRGVVLVSLQPVYFLTRSLWLHDLSLSEGGMKQHRMARHGSSAVKVNLPQDLTANGANLKQWPDYRWRSGCIEACRRSCSQNADNVYCRDVSELKYNLLYKQACLFSPHLFSVITSATRVVYSLFVCLFVCMLVAFLKCFNDRF